MRDLNQFYLKRINNLVKIWRIIFIMLKFPNQSTIF